MDISQKEKYNCSQYRAEYPTDGSNPCISPLKYAWFQYIEPYWTYIPFSFNLKHSLQKLNSPISPQKAKN